MMLWSDLLERTQRLCVAGSGRVMRRRAASEVPPRDLRPRVFFFSKKKKDAGTEVSRLFFFSATLSFGAEKKTHAHVGKTEGNAPHTRRRRSGHATLRFLLLGNAVHRGKALRQLAKNASALLKRNGRRSSPKASARPRPQARPIS